MYQIAYPKYMLRMQKIFQEFKIGLCNLISTLLEAMKFILTRHTVYSLFGVDVSLKSNSIQNQIKVIE